MALEPFALTPGQHLAWLTSNVESLILAATRAPDSAVQACPGWNCIDVIDHVMRGLPVYSAFLQMDAHTNPMEAVTAEAAAVNDWREGVEDVLGAAQEQLDIFIALANSLDPASEVLFWDGPGTAAKMFWHGAAESWIHTHDVATALGDDLELSQSQAADLLTWSAMFRRLVCAGQGLDSASTVVLESTDTAQSETLGSGEPVAVVRGSAVALSLRLWNRPPGQSLEGDGPTLSVWADVALTSPLG